MPEQIIGHIQDGFGGAVIFLELDDLCIRVIPGEFQDVFNRSPAERVNGLRFVAHGHNRRGVPAVGPGKQAHKSRLYKVCVLILVHQDIAVTVPDGFRSVLILQEHGLELEQKIIIVHELLVVLELLVGVSDFLQIRGVKHEVRARLFKQFLNRNLLVARGTVQGKNGFAFWEASVLRNTEIRAALPHCGKRVRGVHHGEGTVLQPVRPVLAQHAIGKGMEGAAGKPRNIGRDEGGRALHHFAGSLTRESQKENLIGINAVFQEPGQPVNNGSGLAGTGTRDNQSGTAAHAGRFVLGAVEECFEICHRASLSTEHAPLS